MKEVGLPAARAAALCGVLAFALAACAPQRILRMPSPPTEFRKEPQLPPGAGGPAPPPPSAPPPAAVPSGAPPGAEPRAIPPAPVVTDRVAAYAEAVDMTTGAMRRGKPGEAVPYWKALEESRWGTDAVFNQGVLFHLAGNADAAVALYGRLADRRPVFEPAAANLLGIHLLRGDREKMTALLERVLPPGSLTGWDALPELQSNAAAALVETGRTEEAAAVLESMASRGRRTPALAWTAAVIAYRRGDRDAARKLAAALPPEIANLFPVFASRFALGEGPDSTAGLPAVPPGQPRLADLLSNLSGYAEYRKGNMAGGEIALTPRKEADHPLPEISTNIGMMQAEQGKWKDARANLEKAVRANPAMPGGWLNLGIFREVYEGNPESARECYEHYVRLKGLRSEEVRKWLDRLGQSAPRP